MLIELSSLIVAIILAVVGSFTFFPVTQGIDFYRPILLFIGGYVVMIFIVWWFFIDLVGRTYSFKKEYDKPSKLANFLLNQGIGYINIHARIKFRVIGKEKIPANEKFLLVCNHRSKFDSMLIAQHFGHLKIAFFSKSSNFKIPLGKRLMWRVCYLPLDRDDKLQSLQQMRRAEKLLSTGATNVGIFPEGTRQTELPIGEFHEGGFNVAIHTGCPIVITTMVGTQYVHKNFPLKRSKCTWEVIGVLHKEDYDGMTAKALSDQIHSIMKENLEKRLK